LRKSYPGKSFKKHDPSRKAETEGLERIGSERERRD